MAEDKLLTELARTLSQCDPLRMQFEINAMDNFRNVVAGTLWKLFIRQPLAPAVLRERTKSPNRKPIGRNIRLERGHQWRKHAGDNVSIFGSRGS